MTNNEDRRGSIITFYSHKGGTGRTMALANIGVLLARGGNRTLLIDWDLEAPGLHRYFYKNLTEKAHSVNSSPGLVDLLIDFQKDYHTIAPIESLGTRQNIEKIKIENYLLNTNIDNLKIIKAGRLDDQYATKINTIGWEKIFNDYEGFFFHFGQLLSKKFDYILIDSRTGYTDSSGICSMILPEKLVLVFTPNQQSLQGVLEISRKAAKYRMSSSDIRPLAMFPLPSRIENAETELKKEWRFDNIDEKMGYQPSFESLFQSIYGFPDLDLTTYFNDVQIQHSSRYAYGEEIAILNDDSKDRLSLSESYNKFLNYLIQDRSIWTIKSKIYGKVFLSFSMEDSDYSLRIKKELDSLGFDVWTTKSILSGSDATSSYVQSFLSESNTFIPIISRGYLTSKSCRFELDSFIELKRLDEKKEVFPIIISEIDNRSSNSLGEFFIITDKEKTDQSIAKTGNLLKAKIYEKYFGKEYLFTSAIEYEFEDALEKPVKHSQSRIIEKKVFLASSSELKEDRNDFEIFINRKNKEWHDNGVFLELVIWEDFLDAMSQTRLQDEYNKAIKECDIFIMLFFTKVGKYTQEEFEKAFGQFKKTGRPLIYTFFRDSNINTSKIDDTMLSMLNFKRKLNELGQFVTVYENIDQLKSKFSEQLTKLADIGFIEIDQTEKSVFAASKFPKELTNSLPKTQPGEIIGRKEDLKVLHDLLYNDQRIVVINGFGGIGKTTLARAYISEYYEDYMHIVWITQVSENIINDFINAEGLLQNLEIKAANPEPQQLFSEVIRKLKSITERPNLLVIDNAEQSLKQYKDLLPSQPNWHLLVTSREEITGFHRKIIDFLSEEQSIQLFQKFYTHHKLTDANIKELVKSVDYHTLAIEILAKTAQLQRYDAVTLQQAIEKDMVAHVEVSHELGEVKRVATYLANVLNISELGEVEVWLMKQFACLPPEFHSYTLLNELLLNEQSLYKDSIVETYNKISQKGWLQYNALIDSYKMPRIVIGIVKKQMAIIIANVKALIKNITLKLQVDQAKDNSVDKFLWIPFGKSILDNFSEDTSEEISALQNNLAAVLQELGDYAGAKALLEKALASTERNYGKDHPSTTRLYSNLASVLTDLADYEGARALLKKALASDEKNFGRDHPSTAISYSNLAGVLQDLGDYEGARILLEKSLASNEKNFGNDHPSTARSYSNLALVLQDLGDYEGARVLLEKALASNEKIFGKDDPSIALRYSNLALVLRDLGDYEGAKVLLEKTLASNEKNFGKDHPSTTRSYSNLALVLQDLKDYEGARVLLEKALASNEKNFGEGHPSTARSYSNLATVLIDLGDYESALELSAKALAIVRKTLHEGHPNIETAENVYESIKEKMKGK